MTRTICAVGTLMVALSASVHIGAQAPAAGPEAPTYSRDVAPILYNRCTMCHRPGEIGPMSLLTYTDTRPWARSIGTRVAVGSMPPWHADPSIGEFVNDRRLTPAEKDTIAARAAAGAPEGNPKDLPAQPRYAEGWTIGEPDVVLPMQEEYPISVSGTIGQPDAGTMNGGNYSLAGGFWEIISAIQTPGAPLLTIHFTTGNRAVVSWPSSSTGFTLQQNANLNTGSWGTPSEAVTDNGTNKFITVNSPTGNRFYRLFKP